MNCTSTCVLCVMCRIDSECNGAVVKAVCDGLGDKFSVEDVKCNFFWNVSSLLCVHIVIYRWSEYLPEKFKEKSN